MHYVSLVLNRIVQINFGLKPSFSFNFDLKPYFSGNFGFKLKPNLKPNALTLYIFMLIRF